MDEEIVPWGIYGVLIHSFGTAGAHLTDALGVVLVVASEQPLERNGISHKVIEYSDDLTEPTHYHFTNARSSSVNE